VITVRRHDPVHASTVRPSAFGSDNWGKVNRFDQVLPGEPVGRGVPFEQTPVYTSFREVFIDGGTWENTRFFHNLMKLMDRQGQVYRCTSREALLERLDSHVGQIWHSMRRHGYRSQAAILESLWLRDAASGDFRPFQVAGYHSAITTNHEIKIGLNEDGDLLFLDGRHRMAIARLLDVPEVPVNVIFRHHLWLERRARLLDLLGQPPADGAGLLEPDHPDLPPRAASPEAVRRAEAEFAARGWPLPGFRPQLNGQGRR